MVLQQIVVSIGKLLVSLYIWEWYFFQRKARVWKSTISFLAFGFLLLVAMGERRELVGALSLATEFRVRVLLGGPMHLVGEVRLIVA